MTPLSSLHKSDQLLISELHEDLKTAGEILSEFLCPVLCTREEQLTAEPTQVLIMCPCPITSIFLNQQEVETQ